MYKVNVLGTEYSVHIRKREQDKSLAECDGYTDFTTKEIVVQDIEPDDTTVKDTDCHMMNVLTHEIVHAYLRESGLDVCSWGRNEEIVDWIALQLPKLTDTINKIKEDGDCVWTQI